jgi:hypothetical protein
MLARSAFVVRMLHLPVTSHIGPQPVFLDLWPAQKSRAMSKILCHTIA